MDRSQIIAEIRRTAAENGGKVLGSRRFTVETGIKESEWCGKYWARWSDACREAGLTPNTRTRRYDDGYVLEQLAKAVKHRGRWPTLAELALVRRTTPGLPSERVLRRIGAKTGQRARRVLEWCCDRAGYADVIDICKPLADETEQPRAQLDGGIPDTRADDRCGWVYLLKSGRFHKIGRTKHTGRRTRDIARQLPEKSRLVHEIRTDDPAGIEAYWHRRFDQKRANGEWFKLNPTDVQAFRRWKRIS